MNESSRQNHSPQLSQSGHSAEKTLATLKSVSYRAGELQDYMDNVCEVLLELLGDGLSAITLYRDGTKQVLALRPVRDAAPSGTMDVHGHLSTYVVNNNAVLKVEDAQTEQRYGVAPEGFCSYLGIPLRVPSGEVVGTLCYFDRNKRRYSERDQQTAELFAERVAIALDNYEMYQRLERYSDAQEALVQERTEELLAARDELAHKEKLAAVGEFATQLTHEIRNPLTTIRLTLEYLQKYPEKSADKRVQLAVGEVARLERMLTEVLLYARPVEADSSELDLAAFCQDFVATYASIADERQQRLVLEVDNTVTVLADRDKLTQILLNLVRNACEAAEPGQDIRLCSGNDAMYGIVTVHNFGDSIPESKLPHITEAFVSGKPNGSGLGLAIVSSLLAAQGGRLELVSDATQGTNVSAYLPRSSS
jgi:signal transduction histidine kinase